MGSKGIWDLVIVMGFLPAWTSNSEGENEEKCISTVEIEDNNNPAENLFGKIH